MQIADAAASRHLLGRDGAVTREELAQVVEQVADVPPDLRPLGKPGALIHPREQDVSLPPEAAAIVFVALLTLCRAWAGGGGRARAVAGERAHLRQGGLRRLGR